MDYSTPADAAAAAAAGTAAVGIFAGVMIFIWILAILGFAIWLWALIDVIRRQFTNPNDKTLWVILVVVLGVIGAIVYLIAGRKKGTIPGK
ncbi:MAG TPA: PLDc N-terminal domain-containing protein [Patescibacteria group bacterium]|nr:PLDc N-terminal domain-containing protein [Patescibacteria group bacterium]